MNKPIRVLIVEDDKNDAILIMRELERGGFEPVYERVETPETMNKALDKDVWDLVICDYIMPHFDGLSALRMFQEKSADIPFIIVSGSIGETIAVEAMLAGAHDYIMKDNLARLVPAVDRELKETELRKSKKKAEEQVRILTSAVEQNPASIVITDQKGDILYVNPQFTSITGYSFEEVNGKNSRILKSGQQSNDFYAQLWSTITNGKIWQGRFCNKKKSGGLFWETQSISPIKDNSGVINHFVAVKLDDTERITARKLVRNVESRLANILKIAEDAFVSVNEEYEIIVFNKGAERLFGYSEKEIIGKPLNTLVPARFRAQHTEHMKRFHASKITSERMGNHPYQLFGLRKNGDEFYAEATISKYKEDGNILCTAVLRDVTDQKIIEDEILKAQKLESVGLLAGGIAHDFNNILTMVLGNVNLAMMISKPEEKIYHNLENIEKATSRATKLTQQLLTFSKGGAPIKKTASIANLIKESTEFSLGGSNVTCESAIPDDIWHVDVDSGQMNQVLNNLIINAVHAMPEGGVIDVNAENVTADDIPQGISLAKGNYVKISIKDNGIGINEEHLPKIFDPYFTTKESGSGLGLASSYSILKKHGGMIRVESQLGSGTTFYLYVPAALKGTATRVESARTLLTGSGKILIMDDENVIRETTKKLLNSIGYKVETAENGFEALELFKKARDINDPFDVVVLDLTVRGAMGGKETIRKLLEVDPEVKAVVFSGYSNDLIMTNYKQFGFKAVVAKPFTIHVMNDVLKKVMGNNQD